MKRRAIWVIMLHSSQYRRRGPVVSFHHAGLLKVECAPAYQVSRPAARTPNLQ